MSLHYLIDGYNLLYALTDIPSGDWAKKRETLLLKIAAERPQGKNSLTVIFDSRQGLGDRARQGDLDIIYTAGETADDWIISKVRKVSNPRVLIVVTDDQGLRRMIRGTGAKWISTAEFWKSAGAAPREPNPSLDPGAVEEINEELRKKWLD